MAELEHLRVLIENEKRDRLELLAQVVSGLGHELPRDRRGSSSVSSSLLPDREVVLPASSAKL